MADDKENIVSHTIELGKRIRDYLAKRSADDEFTELRREAGELTLELAKAPFNSVTVQRTIDCVRKFEELNCRRMSHPTGDRSSVNPSVLSVRVRATHYSAFLAGRYGESDIGSKFKSWIYNVAAHGAIETAVLIDGLLKVSKRAAHPDLIATAKLFRSSAISDASRFLEWSRKHDEKSVLRSYNSARIDIISSIPDQVRIGIEALCKIDPPDESAEAPDICWHEDNWKTFEGDSTLREIIEREAAHSYTVIKGNLERNCNAATLLREMRGDIWKDEYKRNNAAIASFGAIMVALGSYAYEHPGLVNDTFEFSQHLFEYLQGIFATSIDPGNTIMAGDGGLASLGDGGLAGRMRFARTVFGDGGLA
jgi:hypothetical protein